MLFPAGYTVNVSRIAPLAQNISQGGFDLLDEAGKPYLLIQPVIQVRAASRLLCAASTVCRRSWHVCSMALTPAQSRGCMGHAHTPQELELYCCAVLSCRCLGA
jgi:hypothetical protein